MIVLRGDRYACEQCIRGHRAVECQHFGKHLIQIKGRGRPGVNDLFLRLRIPPNPRVVGQQEIPVDIKNKRGKEGKKIKCFYLDDETDGVLWRVQLKSKFSLLEPATPAEVAEANTNTTFRANGSTALERSANEQHKILRTSITADRSITGVAALGLEEDNPTNQAVLTSTSRNSSIFSNMSVSSIESSCFSDSPYLMSSSDGTSKSFVKENMPHGGASGDVSRDGYLDHQNTLTLGHAQDHCQETECTTTDGTFVYPRVTDSLHSVTSYYGKTSARIFNEFSLPNELAVFTHQSGRGQVLNSSDARSSFQKSFYDHVLPDLNSFVSPNNEDSSAVMSRLQNSYELEWLHQSENDTTAAALYSAIVDLPSQTMDKP